MLEGTQIYEVKEQPGNESSILPYEIAIFKTE